MRKHLFFCFLTILFLLSGKNVSAQGVTSSTLSGTISDSDGPLPGGTIEVLHVPSGTKSGTISSANGTFNIQGLRVGGPYTLRFSYVGYQPQAITDVQLNLGENAVFNIKMENGMQNLDEIVISANQNLSMKKETKGGVGMVLNKAAFTMMPTVSRSINDFTRLLPQAGSQGILGKGAKSNNMTIDGASFNNFFGLGGEGGGMPGVNAGAQPISLDALDQIAIDASPYDVKLGGFTGAGINVVTKSGDNTVRASAYDYFRNQSFTGRKIKDAELPEADFTENTVGFRIGGPIIKNKVFFFANAEYTKKVTPVSNIVMGRDGLSGTNVSTVQASTMDALSQFLQSQYNYNPGSYEGVDRNQESIKFLIKLDWNINNNNKLSVRYNQLNAKSLNGNLGTITSGRFDGLLYNRNNEIYSITGELNSKINNNLSNRLFAAFNSMPDYRSPYGSHIFPLVNITDNGSTIAFGTDAAANDNRVEQKIYQLQDELTYLLGKNKFTAGINWQFMNLSNNFTLNPQGTFNFNSLADFYNSAPMGTQTPIGASTGTGLPARYTLNYTVQPGRTMTLSNPKISQLGIYLQDEIAFNDFFALTAGVRFDIISILNKPKNNPAVPDMTFQTASGVPVHYNTSETPGTKLLFSPRLGFNWKLDQEQNLSLKGGVGMFTGVIPFVYIEKQYSINGMNEGAINATGTDVTNYLFNPTNAYYKPENGGTLSSYELDLVSKDFKMPQVLRSSLGLDYRLPHNWRVGVEAIYSKDFNSPYYVNANLDQTSTTQAADGRTYYTNNRLNDKITNAYVLERTNKGYQMFLTASLKKAFESGLAFSVAYTYGQSKSPYEFPSTTPSGAFNAVPIVGNPNIPVVSYSTFDLRHRIIGDLSYRVSYAKDRLATTIGLFVHASQQGRTSYIYGGNGDVNGDGSQKNDLIFVPADKSQINLVEYTSGNKTVTVDEQWNALNRFIEDSPYLKSRRGKFAERNGAINPWYMQMDLHLAQEFAIDKRKHKFEITLDILNLTNMLNKNWGVIQTAANKTPITAKSKDSFTVSPENLKKGEFVPLIDQSSAWSLQIGFRYTFN